MDGLPKSPVGQEKRFSRNTNSSVQMEELILSQVTEGKEIERLIINYRKDSLHRKTLDYLRAKLENLEQLWANFDRGHQAVLRFGPNESEYITSRYYEKVSNGFAKLKEDILEQLALKNGAPPSVENAAAKTDDKVPPAQPSTSKKAPSKMSFPEDSELAALFRRQRALISVLQRLINDIERRLHSPNSSIYYQVKIEAVTKYWDEISAINQSIWAVCGEPERYDYDINTICDIEESTQDIIIRLKELLHSASPPSPGGSSGPSTLKLPHIKLPTFDGNYLEWRSFSELYRRLIHEQPMSKTEKMFYLMANLSGEAKRLIQHFPVSESSYSSAWDTLVDRYDNQRLLVISILNRLLGQSACQLDSASSIKSLHDVTKECILGLENLGVSTKSWDAFLAHITVKKMDRNTHGLYEQALEYPKQIQGIQELLNFLDARFQSLQTLGRTSGQRPQAENRSKGSSLVTSGTTACPLCNLVHAIYTCPKFLKMDVNSRCQAVRTHKLCMNCLQCGHFVSQCQLGSCKKCSKRHNTLLHEETTAARYVTQARRPEASTSSTSSAALTSEAIINNRSSYVFLATVVIHIMDKHNNPIECRAVLDSGSQLNFISAELAKRLQLTHTSCNTIVAGIGSREYRAQQRLYTKIQSRLNNFSVDIEAVVLPKITNNQPARFVDIKHWNLPSNIKLADPDFYKPKKIDLLIGAEHFSALMSVGQIQLDKTLPTLQNTIFGWVVLGRSSDHTSPKAFCGVATIDETTFDIQRLWELEQVSTPVQPRTQAESLCEKYFEKSTTRDHSGRFVVRLPFKKDPTVLGQSKETAVRRFISLEKRMNKDSLLKSQYVAFMDEYLKLKHMERIQESEIQRSHYFIPHHCVLKPSSTTTKLRVVFDASCKTSTNISLNEILFKGPTIQDDLFSILTRFHLHKYVFTADIEKMYRQILIDTRDQEYQLIVYRNEVTKDMEFYRLKTLTYGTTPASFLATKCLQKLSEENASVYPLGSKVARRDFYVDDIMTGSNNLNEALQMQAQLRGLLKGAGFNLRKWCSNNPMLLATIPDADIEFKLDLNDKGEEGIKTLGVTWMPKADQFLIQTNWPTLKRITKRSILADIAHIFDPLGLINPVIVHCKIFFQQLWKLKLDWDAALPEELHTRWLKFRDDLPLLNKLTIPRQACIATSKALYQIHGFSDASEKAYGVAIYLRSIDTKGNTTVRLLCAASRVAPVKTVTLPRLELCAARMLAHMTNRVKHILELNDDQIFYWCDSKIVLGWIRAESSSYKTFVANRISSIQNSSSIQHWKHVNTNLNPADLVSRGVSPSILLTSQLWFNGPDYLRKSPFEWPSEDASTEDTKIELKASSLVATAHKRAHFIDVINHRNSFKHLIRVVAYVARFVKNLHCRTNRSAGSLTAMETNAALKITIRHIQSQGFGEEQRTLKAGKQLNKHNRLASLTPFVDKDNILRVGGRLQAANIPYDTKHPMLLPRDHALTRLLVTEAHKTNFHAGPQALLSIIRQRFWPLKGKLLTRSVVQHCIRCFKAKPTLGTQLMGNLPAPRIQEGRPFLHSGVDFCGPIWTHFKIRGKRPQKSYIAVFCCFSTKAVHLEVVSDLSTDSFLGALKRFFGRRGNSRSIYCDNATNFLGAYNRLEELKDMLQTKEVQEKIASLCLSRGTDFHFIPPRAPHFGGLWEAAVKSAKQLLFKTIHPVSLTYEELETAIVEIEAILNSRPLTPLSSDPNDLTALTPGHFLIGEALTSLPEATISTDRPSLLTRWRLVQYIKTEFWKRWTKEYLCELQQRVKWTQKSANINPGTLVLIKDDSLPPLKWHMGRILQAVKGDDGLVRVADVKTATGVFRRPIHRLCPLPIDPEVVPENQKDAISAGTYPEPASKRSHQRDSAISENTKPVTTSENAPKKRRRKGGAINALSLLLLTLILPAFSESIQITSFPSPPGLYFENIGTTNLISDEWKIIVYYNMTTYWQEANDLAIEIDKLGELCKQSKGGGYCSAILEQLQHQFGQIQELNKLLITRETKARKRRAPLEIIGSISSSLFGLLDQDYAEELSRTIEAMQHNDAHLKDMIQAQTLIIESTANVLKSTDDKIQRQFAHLDNEMGSLVTELTSIKSEVLVERLQRSITWTSIHLTLILQNYQNVQSTLLDVLMNIQHGRISPLLVTPEQLDAGMNKIRPHLPLSRRLPDYEGRTDILQLFRLMSLQGRATSDYIIAEIRIPLLTDERFDTFQVVPVPMTLKRGNARVTQTTDILIIDPHRDQYLPITLADFSKCTQLFNGEFFCRQSHPIYHRGSNQSRCEINLLNHVEFSTSGCSVIITDELQKWTPLHSPNQWIYSVSKTSIINIVCSEKLTQATLIDSGILTIDNSCIIKDDRMTISSQNVVATQMKVSFIPSANRTLNFSTTIFKDLAHTISNYQSEAQNIASLQSQIQQLKFNQTKPLENTVQEIHQFSIAYVTFFLILGLAGYIAWTKFKAKIISPTPAPRARISTNPDFTFQAV